MTGTEFLALFAKKGYVAWEAAALQLAREARLTPRAWVPITLTDGTDTAIVQVQNDVVAVGPPEDSLRLPLTPTAAQAILNVMPEGGAFLPTPWLVYQMFRAAPVKLQPTKQPVSAKLEDFARHSAAIDQQLAALGPEARGRLISGAKKHVVVSNIYQPKKVLIHGWYKPPPHPDVFDDGSHWTSPDRQPQQVKSNAHGDFYFDYSHGIQAVHPIAVVNGRPMLTEDLYKHPTLSRLVSNEGPVRVTRYPTSVPVAPVPAGVAQAAADAVASGQPGFSIQPVTFSPSEVAIDMFPWRRS